MSQHTHMRPADPALLYDQRNHITELIWARHHLQKLRCMQDEFNREAWDLNEVQVELVKRTVLHYLGELKKPVFDVELLTALVERWRPETNTFHFSFGKAIVTLEDVSFIYGLPIDGPPIIGRTYAEEDTFNGLFQELLGRVPPNSELKGSQVTNTWIQQTFGRKPENPSPDEIFQVHAFLLDLVSSQILANTTGAHAYTIIN